MSVELEKNIYGLSEGVYDACLFLGLKFPSEVKQTNEEHLPSDYFGDNFEFDSETLKKMCVDKKWSEQRFYEVYDLFAKKFSSNLDIKHNKTNLNVYFCDFLLFSGNQQTIHCDIYFSYEFYKKNFEQQLTFLMWRHFWQRIITCNDHGYIGLTENKSETNTLFANFLHRDWLDTRKSTFVDFKNFVKKHSRFFAKPVGGTQGKNARIVQLDPDQDIEELFVIMKKQNNVLEELITQHEEIAEFCPDTVNTLRINTMLDIHDVVHILTVNGRFGRIGHYVDNYHAGGCAVTVDPTTGIITSDAVTEYNERFQKHPDSGKIFKGFQYPSWKKICKTVKQMAKMIPHLRHIGWDIVVDFKGEPLLVEANAFADMAIQQVPDSVGKLPLYQPFLEEMQDYKQKEMKLLGYRVNDISNFVTSYDPMVSRNENRLKFIISKLITSCTSLIDLGCRKNKPIKLLCPQNVKYYPVDYIKHDEEVTVWDFVGNNLPPPPCDC